MPDAAAAARTDLATLLTPEMLFYPPRFGDECDYASSRPSLSNGFIAASPVVLPDDEIDAPLHARVAAAGAGALFSPPSEPTPPDLKPNCLREQGILQKCSRCR